jgi:head-tail adaptor
MMRPSDLRRRVVLQQRSAAQDTAGQRLRVWTDYLVGPAIDAAKSITGVTAGATTLLACTAHGFVEGQLVTLAGITGMPGLPCTFGVLAPSTNAFSVRLDTTGLTLAVSSATATPVAGVPASIEPLSGRESYEASELQASITHRIGMRYHSLLIDPIKVAALRAIYVHGAVSHVYNLSAAVNADMRNRWLTVMASQGLSEG